jgi:hypothetical protein
MKKLLVMVMLLAGLASAYCSNGTKVSQNYVGGHIEATYDFYGEGTLTFSFRSGQNIPFTMRYDFWTGQVCD